MSKPAFNAENLRTLTDTSRKPVEVKIAHKFFKELQMRAWVKASEGKNTAGLSRHETGQLGDHGFRELSELCERAGLQFLTGHGAVWVKW